MKELQPGTVLAAEDDLAGQDGTEGCSGHALLGSHGHGADADDFPLQVAYEKLAACSVDVSPWHCVDRVEEADADPARGQQRHRHGDQEDHAARRDEGEPEHVWRHRRGHLPLLLVGYHEDVLVPARRAGRLEHRALRQAAGAVHDLPVLLPGRLLAPQQLGPRRVALVVRLRSDGRVGRAVGHNLLTRCGTLRGIFQYGRENGRAIAVPHQGVLDTHSMLQAWPPSVRHL
mmetsp:Transcript_127755/g.361615  ORF Transcript_127755/g.361615 Transcript_127755/m.361615 type:complete len:231 (+) Transcript_127755:489-1181(+)